MMKRTNINILNTLICLLVLLFTCQYAHAQGVKKNIRVGAIQGRVVDSGDEGEGTMGWAGGARVYYSGYLRGGLFSSKAIYLGTKSFTDTLNETFTPKLSGHGQWMNDDARILMPVPDADGFTIHRYMKQEPVTIEVDGYPLEEPWPMNPSDHVGGTVGTADAMVESWINSDMGITIHQRVFGYSNVYHDDYMIYEWTFKNTGSVDKYPGANFEVVQTLDSVYFLKQLRPFESRKPWMSYYGEMPTDTLRIMYGYPMRQSNADYDALGYMNKTGSYNRWIRYPWFTAEGILFASAAVNDMDTNDPNQPHMTGYYDCDLEMVTLHSLELNESQTENLYGVMKYGFGRGYTREDNDRNLAARPGYHDVDPDEKGNKFADYEIWWGYTLSGLFSVGPYTLAPGDSFKVVWAQVGGMISSEKGWEIGNQWADDNVTPPPGMVYNADRTLCVDNLTPIYDLYPELYAADAMASAESNWAKDCWVYTGKDSLFQNVAAAQWAYDNNYIVPEAPPAPSLKVTSTPGEITVEWGNQAEGASDLAGYRVYRAAGQWWPGKRSGSAPFLGGWELQETFAPGTFIYHDVSPARGEAYYYYVTAFDDGNTPDFDGVSRSLESNMMANVTQLRPAYLSKPASTLLDSIRIVPNPFNLSAEELQYSGEPNKIMFLNLPMTVTIKIYTESGDLIQTIEHSGSGDEPWGVLTEEHSATLSGQRVVSGIYIAHFKTADDEIIKKFVVVR